MIVLAVLTVVSATAAPDPSPSKQDSTGISPVDVSRLEAVVQQQLSRARAHLAELTGKAELPAGVLAAAYGELGNLYYAYGIWAPGQACYLKAQTLSPQDLRWPYYLGRLYADSNGAVGSREAMMASFERVLALQPDYQPALLQLGNVLLAGGQLEQAQRSFSQALKAKPAEAAALAGLGKIALVRKDYARAAERLEAALEAQPAANKLYVPLALAYRGAGDLARARASLARRGERDVVFREPLMEPFADIKSGARAHILKGVAAVKLHKLAVAREEFRKAVAADPDNFSARLNLGATLAQMGDREGALEALSAALRLKPLDATAQFNLATLLAMDGRDREALEHFRKVVAIADDHDGGHLALGDALMRTGRFAEAVRHYRRAATLQPEDGRPHLRWAMSLIRLGRDVEAKRVLEDALKLFPKQGEIWHALARLCASSADASVRDGSRALRIAQALFRARQSVEFGQTLAMAYAETGDFERAEALQVRLVDAAPRIDPGVTLAVLKQDLASFRRGQASRVPWPPEAAVFRPQVGR